MISLHKGPYTVINSCCMPGSLSFHSHICVWETGVGWDTFNFFSNIAEDIYERDFELTQGRGILPVQTLLQTYVVPSFIATE